MAADETYRAAGMPPLGDEPTIDLVTRARSGNREAMTALLERCLPTLRRWAHGRLPLGARGAFDTDDLVQEVALQSFAHLDTFVPRHVGSMQAYLRQAIVNRVIDEVRRAGRRPPGDELPLDLEVDAPSPLELAIRSESYDRYRAALQQLTARDRALIIGRIEMQWTLGEIALRFNVPTVNAARMAVSRATRRLTRILATEP